MLSYAAEMIEGETMVSRVNSAWEAQRSVPVPRQNAKKKDVFHHFHMLACRWIAPENTLSV